MSSISKIVLFFAILTSMAFAQRPSRPSDQQYEKARAVVEQRIAHLWEKSVWGIGYAACNPVTGRITRGSQFEPCISIWVKKRSDVKAVMDVLPENQSKPYRYLGVLVTVWVNQPGELVLQ